MKSLHLKAVYVLMLPMDSSYSALVSMAEIKCKKIVCSGTKGAWAVPTGGKPPTFLTQAASTAGIYAKPCATRKKSRFYRLVHALRPTDEAHRIGDKSPYHSLTLSSGEYKA